LKIAIKTLGCKVNQAESDLLAALLKRENIHIVDFEETADMYIINSCAVTKMSEKKTRQWVRRALRNNQHSKIFLLGCYSRLLSAHPFPFDSRVQIVDSRDKIKEMANILNLGQERNLSDPVIPEIKRARIWLKVEDGCDHYCHYCIVPHLRGPVRSEDPQRIINQAICLEKSGIREIVLSGINLGMYGKDSGESHLIDLLENLIQATELVRYRLSSIEPFLIDKNFLDRYFFLGSRVCPHFHIPLQSASDQILSKMGRGYTTDDFERLINTIRNYHPEIAISTDIIVGFPGETKALFQETVDFCQKIKFSRTHVFVFSPRPGTLAAQWEPSEGIAAEEKKEREHILLELAQQNQCDYHHSFIGKRLSVLVESVSENGEGSGYSENYISVRIRAIRPVEYGHILPVFIEEQTNRILIGKAQRGE